MSVTAIEGVVENGQIRLGGDIFLSEKTKMYVIVPDHHAIPTPRIHTPRLADPEQAKDFRKEILEVPRDAI